MYGCQWWGHYCASESVTVWSNHALMMNFGRNRGIGNLHALGNGSWQDSFILCML
jgi:hypothetical protein